MDETKALCAIACGRKELFFRSKFHSDKKYYATALAIIHSCAIISKSSSTKQFYLH